MIEFSRPAAGAVLALLAAAPVWADNWGGGIGIGSDKVVRGQSQTGGRASLMLDLFYRTDTGWALSLGAASLHDNGRGTDSEWSATLARSWRPSDGWTTQLSATHYAYPGSSAPRYRAYDEIGASLAWREVLSLGLALSPNSSGALRGGQPVRGRVLALELGAHVPLSGRWSLDAGLGWVDPQRIGGARHAYGSVGVTGGFGPVQLFVSRVTSRAGERAGVPERFAGDRTVVSVWRTF